MMATAGDMASGGGKGDSIRGRVYAAAYATYCAAPQHITKSNLLKQSLLAP